jgi:hypothetical protein
MPRQRPQTQRSIDIFGHVFLLIPSMLVILYWSWPSVRNSWKILEGPISVGGIEAVFLLKSLIPAFCVLLVIQSLSLLIRLCCLKPPGPGQGMTEYLDLIMFAALIGAILLRLSGVVLHRRRRRRVCLSRLGAGRMDITLLGATGQRAVRPDFQPGADRHSRSSC